MAVVWFPTQWLVLSGSWLSAFGASLGYLPVAIPFALGTVVGGIDCSESAAAAGDEYDTRAVIAIEGVATLVAVLCGGVIQTTPTSGIRPPRSEVLLSTSGVEPCDFDGLIHGADLQREIECQALSDVTRMPF